MLGTVFALWLPLVPLFLIMRHTLGSRSNLRCAACLLDTLQSFMPLKGKERLSIEHQVLVWPACKGGSSRAVGMGAVQEPADILPSQQEQEEQQRQDCGASGDLQGHCGRGRGLPGAAGGGGLLAAYGPLLRAERQGPQRRAAMRAAWHGQDAVG